MTLAPGGSSHHEQFALERRALYVIQHTDAEYLGLIEDHLEGRSIGFTYMRPHTTGGRLPATVKFTDGVVLLGGGPWGSAGERDLPTLKEEVQLQPRHRQLQPSASYHPDFCHFWHHFCSFH